MCKLRLQQWLLLAALFVAVVWKAWLLPGSL
jgi:hypothetical protein